MVENFVLFGTDCCHLCEQAKDLLNACESMRTGQIVVEQIDIVEHPQWFDKYSVHIPVFYHQQSQMELAWPFDQQALTIFIDNIVERNQPG